MRKQPPACRSRKQKRRHTYGRDPMQCTRHHRRQTLSIACFICTPKLKLSS
jgi:hypothetical protein